MRGVGAVVRSQPQAWTLRVLLGDAAACEVGREARGGAVSSFLSAFDSGIPLNKFKTPAPSVACISTAFKSSWVSVDKRRRIASNEEWTGVVERAVPCIWRSSKKEQTVARA